MKRMFTWLMMFGFAGAIAACGKTNTGTTAGASTCVAADASIKPITLAGKNPFWMATTTDGTRVLVTVPGNLGAAEVDGGVESVNVATMASTGIAPTEASIDAGMQVGSLAAFAIQSATKAYVVAGDTGFSTYALYKFNPTTGASVQKIALDSTHEGCYMNEIALHSAGNRLFATCIKGVSVKGVLSLDTSTDTENVSEFRTTANMPQSLAVYTPDGGTLLVAMTDNAVGTLGKVPLSPSVGALSINSGVSDALGKDPVIRYVSSGSVSHVMAINRSGFGAGGSINNLQFLDPANGFSTKPGKQFSTGTNSNPYDVAIGSATDLWVVLYGATVNQLMAMNPDTGATNKSIDLTPLATAGNLPRPTMMVTVGGKIWIVLQDSDVNYANQGKGKIVILNPAESCIESAL